jgi:hypothetical protein
VAGLPTLDDVDGAEGRDLLRSRLAGFLQWEQEEAHRLGRHQPFTSITVTNRLGTGTGPCAGLGKRVVAWLASQSLVRLVETPAGSMHAVPRYVFCDDDRPAPDELAAACVGALLPESVPAWRALARQLAAASVPDGDLIRALVFTAFTPPEDRATVRRLLLDVRELEGTLIDMLWAGA